MLAAAVLSAIVSCVKNLEDEGIFDSTEYTGVVIEKSTNTPIAGVMVQVTDGTHIHAQGETNAQGRFDIEGVDFEEVDEDYYLWLDGTALQLPSKQEELRGLGQQIYDYKTLILYDKTNADILPNVSTGEVTGVTASFANVGGSASSEEKYPITERGICFATHQVPTIDDATVTAGSGAGSFSCELKNLTKNTTYYVRAYAINSIGITYGAQKMFTTKDGKAKVALNAPSAITASSASFSGAVSDDGGASVTARGFCWATTQNPTISNSKSTNGSGTGSFTHTASNLQVGTTYHVRAYATNAFGTVYSEDRTFTTADGRPTVTTAVASNVTATSFTCGGNVTNDGGFSVTAKGLCWSTNQLPTIADNHNTLGSGLGSFTGSCNGLTRSTTYYVRAYATNSKGTSYGEQRTVTTASGLPAVTTTAVSMSGSSVVSGGNVTSDGGSPVTARGICYGPYPNPDLSSTYTHTSNGTGTGYFTSVIGSSLTGTTYVRAYATNANGTSYGNQVTANLEYLALPTFEYNGHTYRVAPDPHTSATEYISWTSANAYCQNLTLYGYSDWRMPTIEELETMYQNRNAIGGFVNSSNYYYSFYHSSTVSSGSYHYLLNWNAGTRSNNSSISHYGFDDSYNNYKHAHVRPIRVEN